MQEKGFFGSLFDIGFRSFVTTKIVSVLFVISMVIGAIYALFIVGTAFAADSAAGIVVLLLSPVIFLLFVLYARVLLEFVVVVFRIYENTSIMAGITPPAGAGGSSQQPTSPAPPPGTGAPEVPPSPSGPPPAAG